eukprot:6212181-Pleurochrysis_carterae.AAC.2
MSPALSHALETVSVPWLSREYELYHFFMIQVANQRLYEKGEIERLKTMARQSNERARQLEQQLADARRDAQRRREVNVTRRAEFEMQVSPEMILLETRIPTSEATVNLRRAIVKVLSALRLGLLKKSEFDKRERERDAEALSLKLKQAEEALQQLVGGFVNDELETSAPLLDTLNEVHAPQPSGGAAGARAGRQVSPKQSVKSAERSGATRR